MQVSKFRARYGATIVVGGIVFGVLILLDRAFHAISVTELVLDDSGVRGSLFSALITVCGVFLAVLLGILALVTSMSDERQVVVVMKVKLKNYDELVHRLMGPIFVGLLVTLFCLVCMVVPSPHPVATDATPEVKAAYASALATRQWMTFLPSFTLAVVAGLFIQTALVARLIGKVLLFSSRGPDASDTPEAALAHFTEQQEEYAREKGAGSKPAKPTTRTAPSVA